MADRVDAEVLQGLREVMEDEFTELLSVFLRESSAQYSRIQALWASGERQAVAALAHSLKGSCANIGAKSCSDLAAEVEKLALQERWEDVSVLLTALSQEMNFAHGELSRLC